ncbi:MAG: histidinol-phosphate transaminase [Pseudomonadota bacterium]|nr:histidinol-phosphate transaminase [Pseudomonadota bacterium]
MKLPKPRAGILDVAPYVGGRHSVDGFEKVILLASNETPLGASPNAINAYRNAAKNMHRYCDGHAIGLRESIGNRFCCDPARIVCGAGSDEIIQMLIRAYAGPGEELIFSKHGFSIYPIFAIGAGVKPVAADETHFTADTDKILSKVTDRTRLVFLANPNNPTGTYITKNSLVKLRERLREDILLVLDGAYAEYVTRTDYTAGIELVEQNENIVITRTCSKIFGLAALRLGWAYCPPAVADVLNRIRSPFNVNGPAQAAGIAAMEDQAHTERSLAHNEEWLPWLSNSLTELGLDIVPSAANFVLASFGSKNVAETVYQGLLNGGIITRHMTSYHLPHCLRISVGLEDDNKALVNSLKDLVGKKNG